MAKRKYEECLEGTGGKYKKNSYTNCFMVGDPSYVVEPVKGIWILAIDANVYLPVKDADVKNPAELPNGSGYTFRRTSIEKIINMVSSCAPNLIICGHVKDSALSENATNNLKTLDLTGKVSRILSAKSDAIGWVHRDEESNLCIQFGADGEVLTGARPAHLANKDIIVAERNEDGTFTPHWDRIFPSLAN